MSSRRTKPQPLSDSEIRQIASDIEAGRPPMVWFTSAAVGVPEGRSGKVLALGDPSEGDFLQVKPAGTKDVLSFGPTEVTLVKPPRPQKEAAAKPKSANAKPTTATRKDSTVTMSSPVTMPSAPPAAPKPEAPQASASTAPQASASTAPQGAASTAPQPSTNTAPANSAAEAGKPAKPASRPARNAAASAAKKSKPAEVTVTLSGTADGEWTLDVVNGKKRTIRGLSVPSSAVAQAAKILHPEVAEVVDSVLDAVRGAQRAKVEQLQAELENARRMLDDLTS
ncbi:hypothetical protein HLB23_06755 [Nocardia uniformis]|uniref:Cell wall anchor protein n=2 Tax=Nocardia uniformis TaxID=53432 RepID=A0A849C3M3_9NOCA|nr:hypothetical protein [Nocardia uniformis]